MWDLKDEMVTVRRAIDVSRRRTAIGFACEKGMSCATHGYILFDASTWENSMQFWSQFTFAEQCKYNSIG